MQHVEEAGVHSGDSSCVLPRAVARRGDARRDRARSCAGSRRRSASSGWSTSSSRVVDGERLRARGEPARVAHRAVREQGDRRQPRRRRLPARRRARASPTSASARGRSPRQVSVKAAVLPVRALPRRRPGARARDALDRRGDGERRRLPDRVREGRARRRPAAADERHGVPLRPRRRQGRRSSRVGRSARRARLRAASRPAGTARALAAAGLAVEHVRKVTEAGDGPTRRRPRSAAGAATSSSTRPQGRGARTDGYLIREAALVARVPCITTIAGAAAAVEAIANARARAGACRSRSGDAEARSRVASPASRRSARTRCCASSAAALDPGVPGPVLHARGARAGCCRGR